MSEVILHLSVFVIILALLLPVIGLCVGVVLYVTGDETVPVSTVVKTYLKSFETNYMNTVIKMSRDETTGEVSVQAFVKNFVSYFYEKAESIVKDVI